MVSSSTNAAKEKEGMEKMMEKMNLTDRESAKLVVDDEEEMQGELILGVAGKVLNRRVLHGTPSDLKFEMMQIWARVINLPFNLRCPPWPEGIAKLVGKVIRVDVDAKGFAFGEALRARVWINVNEPLMRWVRLESAKTKEVVFYDIQYEALPYFCFSCGCMGQADLYCPSPTGRDANGRLPYGENLRIPIRKRSWGNIPMRGGRYPTAGRQEEQGEEEDEVEKGEEVTSPDKATDGRVQAAVYQFNARGGGSGRGARFRGDVTILMERTKFIEG
ncbi:hypothetical protein D1007_58861 [Hordeum vulgare]|nr:hypothetical protein D1007_58861 [Hordeum vulgare]